MKTDNPGQLPETLLKRLNQLQQAGRFRQLRQADNSTIDFTSNDYLGIGRANSTTPGRVMLSGSGGSRLLGGNTQYHEAVESFAAEWLDADTALLYNSGYDANIGVLSCIPGKGDTILYDNRCHASLKDGIRLSPASRFPFRDLPELKKKLSTISGQVYIVTEALFSMDGDWCPIEEMVQLSRNRPDTRIILDESHSTGIIGPQGKGLAAARGVVPDLFIRIHTFGKACGISGAVVLGSADTRDYLINFSRTFIYTTAMPAGLAETILRHLQQTRDADEARDLLWENVRIWEQVSGHPALSPILPWIIPGNEACRQRAELLRKSGFEVRAILSPTVPEGGERLRIILHVFNTQEEIEKLITVLKQADAPLID